MDGRLVVRRTASAALALALVGCGAAVPQPVGWAASATGRFAAREGRYAMLSTWTGEDGRSQQETGTMDVWAEGDRTVRMTIALGDDDQPEAWAELYEGLGCDTLVWRTVTGNIEPSFQEWYGTILDNGRIEMELVGDDGEPPDEQVEAVFTFPDDGSLRLTLTSLRADGSVRSTEDYVFTRTGPTERVWAPSAPLPPVPPPALLDGAGLPDCSGRQEHSRGHS